MFPSLLLSPNLTKSACMWYIMTVFWSAPVPSLIFIFSFSETLSLIISRSTSTSPLCRLLSSHAAYSHSSTQPGGG